VTHELEQLQQLVEEFSTQLQTAVARIEELESRPEADQIAGNTARLNAAGEVEEITTGNEALAGEMPWATGEDTEVWLSPLAINPKAPPYNCKFDLYATVKGSIAEESNELTVGGYIFTTADIGKQHNVQGAGVAAGELSGEIIGVTKGKAVLSVAASTTVAGANTLFGTDDTIGLNKAFADVSGSGHGAIPLAREIIMPQGAALVTKLLAPRHGAVRGCTPAWQQTGRVFSFYEGWTQNGGTTIYQKWGQTEDAVRCKQISGLEWAGIMEGFCVLQHPTNTGGKGISFRNAAGEPLLLVDGAKFRNIRVEGFASAGIEIPTGAVPGLFENVNVEQNGLVDGSPGILYTCHGTGDDMTFTFPSGAKNATALIEIKGAGATKGKIRITDLHSEFGPNEIRRPGGAPCQANAVILNNIPRACVDIAGITHRADSNSKGFGAESELGAAIKSTGGTPNLTWKACNVTVQEPQTQGYAYENVTKKEKIAAAGGTLLVTGNGEYNLGEGHSRSVRAIGDEATNITLTDDLLVYTTTLTGEHAANLPQVAGAEGPAPRLGQEFELKDATGLMSNTLLVNVAAHAGDTLVGDTQLVSPYSTLKVVWDGTVWVGTLTVNPVMDWKNPTSGEEVMPLAEAQATALALTTGQMLFTIFEAKRTEPITKIRIPTGTTGHLAEGAGAAVEAGIFTVASNGALALITKTASEVKAMEKAQEETQQALLAEWAKKRGVKYAYGLLVVSSAMPTTVGANFASAAIAGGGNGRPRRCGVVTGLASIPAEVAPGSIANLVRAPYAMFVP